MNLLLAAKIVWAVGVVGWYVIRIPFERKVKRERVIDARHRLRELVLLSCSTMGLGIIPLFWATSHVFDYADYPYSVAQFGLGTLVFALSLWLFRRTHADLGRNWSVTLETRKKHELVATGVYAWVRHPMYSAFWLLAVAQAFLLANWIAGLAGIVGWGILFFLRVGHEERLMIDTFGRDYVDYMGRTKRVVPWVY